MTYAVGANQAAQSYWDLQGKQTQIFGPSYNQNLTNQQNPADLSITTELNTYSGTLTTYIANAQNMTALLNVASAGQTSQMDSLQKIYSLATQAASDPSNYAALSSAINGYLSLVQNTATSTNFSGTNLLDGSYTNKTAAVSQTPTSVSIASSTLSGLGLPSSVSITSQSQATAIMSTVQSAINTLASNQASLASQQGQIAESVSINTEALSANNKMVSVTNPSKTIDNILNPNNENIAMAVASQASALRSSVLMHLLQPISTKNNNSQY